MKTSITRWAVKFRSKNKLDGNTEFYVFNQEHNCHDLFCTRKDAVKFIEERYSYIRTSKDLQQEPHGWKMPIPVRVTVTIEPKNK